MNASESRFCLVDANAFYCSCERVFDPSLNGKPLIVLSNNDGCAVSRTDEAKALGVAMGEPWHHIVQRLGEDAVIARSSNYVLYHDMSCRFTEILKDAAPAFEPYSIDESFLLIDGVPDPANFGREVKQRVLEWTGLPCCAGIGSTRTRSKLANAIAKKQRHHEGVFDLESLSESDCDALLASLPVAEVWGVGRRLSLRLEPLGIRTVLDLKDCDPNLLRSHFSVVLQRTALELRGVSCISTESMHEHQQQIMCSRSFSSEITTFDELKQAVLSYAARAAERAREQGLVAGALVVFVETNRFKSVAQCNRSATVSIPTNTADTIEIGHAAIEGLRRVYRPGFKFKKCGVMLVELSPAGSRQATLLDNPVELERRKRLNATMDKVNSKFGRGSLISAGARRQGVARWSMRRNQLSPSYTTQWDQLPVVR